MGIGKEVWRGAGKLQASLWEIIATQLWLHKPQEWEATRGTPGWVGKVGPEDGRG